MYNRPLPTIVETVDVALAPAPNLGPFYSAPSDAWVRLLIRNVGGNTIFIAFASSVLNTLPGGVSGTGLKRYELPATMSDVIVLAPQQQVFAIAGGAARLTYSASVALPMAVTAG